jgi:CubicO group peptidase (beta-lactamase class C family)
MQPFKCSTFGLIAICALVLVTPGKAADVKTVVDGAVEPFLKSRPYAGVVVGVVNRDGRRVFGYGKVVLNGTEQVPSGDTLFEIGSMTKAFTGTLLADQVRAGAVRLDDSAQKYLSEGLVLPRRDDRDITLLHLATHTSSLPVQPPTIVSFALSTKDPKNPYAEYDFTQLRKTLETLRLKRPIGCEYEYSNLGVGLLGHALAHGAHSPSYEALLRERVLRPLAMTDTCIHLDDSQKRRLAPGHGKQGKPTSPWDWPCLEACGGLRSTVHDLMIFAAANLGLQQTSLLPTFQMAHQAWRETGQLKGLYIGLCWQRNERGNNVVIWHNGGTGGYWSYLGLVPGKDVGVVVLCNADHPVDGVASLILKGLFSKDEKPKDGGQTSGKPKG